MIQVEERRRSKLGAIWDRLWAPSTEETAIAKYSQNEIDDVDALLPTSFPEYPAWKTTKIRASRTQRIVLILGAGAILSSVGATLEFGKNPRCTFRDGSSVAGRCLFIEEFDSLNSSVWLKEADLVSALLEHAAPWGCVRPENVAVVGGNLELTMSDNVRVACPQTWTPTAFYNTNILPAGFITPAPTAYDTAAISMKTFKFKYGHVFVRARMPSQISPWGAILLWGEDCQAGGAMSSLMNGIFNHTGTCNWPAPGSGEFDMPSYVWNSGVGHNQAIDAVHVGPAFAAPFLRNYAIGGLSVPYYGAEYAPTVTVAGYQKFVTDLPLGDLSAAFHIYELVWLPGQFTFLVDGQIAGRTTAAWVPSEFAFMQLWNVDNSAAASGLPQKMLVDWVRITCDPGVPCETN